VFREKKALNSMLVANREPEPFTACKQTRPPEGDEKTESRVRANIQKLINPKKRRKAKKRNSGAK